MRDTTKTVLIIGGSGFLGSLIALRLREGYKVFATHHEHRIRIPGVTFIPLHLANRNWSKQILAVTKPDVIIFAAGSNDPLWAEENMREAERIHVAGPGSVTMISESQPKFIYLSSCYLFDGNRGNYHETDVVLPALTLGKLKLGGENFIRGKSVNYNIVRLCPLYGRGTGIRLSFLDRLRMQLDRKQRIELSGSELHAFAPASGAVDLIVRLVDGGPKNKILHYGGLTKVSYADFARKFAARFGYDSDLIVETKTRSSQLLDYSLNSTYVTQNLKVQPLLLEEGFDLIEKQLVPGA